MRISLSYILTATSYGKPLKTADSRPQNPSYSLPKLVVHGKPFVTSGDTIRIVCNVSGSSDVPQDIDWFKNGNMIHPKEHKISISKDKSIAKKTLNSVLEIRNSRLEDSGTYLCRNSELLIKSLRVQVLNEDKSNTGKRVPKTPFPNAKLPEECDIIEKCAAGETTNGQMCNRQWWTRFVSVMLLSLLTAFYSFSIT